MHRLARWLLTRPLARRTPAARRPPLALVALEPREVPNAAPVAADDAYAVHHRGTLDVLAPGVLGNDSDPDGNPLTASLVSGPAHAAQFSFLSGGRFVYRPAAGFVGTDSFVYRASDGKGGTADATVTVAVTNSPPVAVSGTLFYPASKNETLRVAAPGLLANGSDPDADPLSARHLAAVPSGQSYPTALGGQVWLSLNGSFVYKPPANVSGAVDSFQYRMSDGAAFTTPVTVLLGIGTPPPTAGNQTPTPVADAASTGEDTPVAVSVLANDSDPDGDPLSVVAVGLAGHGTVTNAGGVLTYSPAADFNGTDSFTYTVSDGRGGYATAAVTVTVAAVNDPPVKTADLAAETDEDTAVTVGAVGNFTDVDGGPLAVQSVSAPAHGAAAATADGKSVVYTPAPDWSGTDSFTYTVSDGNGGTATATVTVTVRPVYDTPLVTVAAAGGPLAEAGGGGTLTFTRDRETGQPLDVFFTLGGTAGVGKDYAVAGAIGLPGGTYRVTLPAGAASAAVTVTAVDDDAVEPSEWAAATLAAGAGYAPAGPAAALRIDDDTRVGVAAGDGLAGEAGPDAGSFVLTRQGDASAALTVRVQAGGTAGAADYALSGAAPVAGSPGQYDVTFAAGSSAAVVAVAPADDLFDEGDETVVLAVLGGAGYTTAGSQAAAAVTIRDDDRFEARDDAAATDVGTAVAVPLLANDSLAVAVKEAGTTITLSDGTQVSFAGGGATVTPAAPPAGLAASATAWEVAFPYTAVDALGNELTATVRVSVRRTETPENNDTDCECQCEVPAPVDGSNGSQNQPSTTSGGPVRYSDGVLSHSAVDLASATFGAGWGVARQWSNHEGYAGPAGEFGNNVAVTQFPRLAPAAGGRVQVVVGGTASLTFLPAAGGGYAALGFGQQVLTYDPATDTFALTDPAGSVLTFAGFGGSVPALRGRLTGIADAGGTATAVAYTAGGQIDYADRTGTVGGAAVTERLDYEQVADGVNDGRVARVTLRRSTDGGATWADVGRVDYTYYGSGDPHGNPGDLRTADALDLFGGGGRTTSYYRYYTPGQPGGYVGGLKYAVEGAGFDDLAAAVGDPFAATDAQVAPFAGFYFEYDAARRVTRERVGGDGCSACTGGLGEYTFAYALNPAAGADPGVNEWVTKTVETLPDGNAHTVFANRYGQVLLRVYAEAATGSEWADYYRYDPAGRLAEHYAPSAVSGYDEGLGDLVGDAGGNAAHLRDAAGLVTVYGYYAATTATETAAGGAAGYTEFTAVRRGELGADVVQGEWAYYARTAGGVTVYPVASDTAFANPDGTGGRTTTYAYTWFAGTVRVASQTVTRPAVSAADNGSGAATASDTAYDVQGRPVWQRDAGGFLTYTEYDPVTGAVVKAIADVDTTRTGTFAGLPAGWATPTGGGLHLTSTYEVDARGRVVTATDPAGRVSHTVYDDAADEVRH